MSIPGFTADASVGPTTQVYRTHAEYRLDGEYSLVPQQWGVGALADWSENLGQDASPTTAEGNFGPEELEGLSGDVDITVDDDVEISDDIDL